MNKTPDKLKERVSLRKWKFRTDEGLTVQETKFCDFFTENPMVKESALKAGIPEHLAQTWGSNILRKIAVKRRIDRNLEEIRNSSVVQARERREILSAIARASVLDAVRVNEHGTPTEIDFLKAKKRGSHRAIASISLEDSTDAMGGVRRSRGIKMTSPIQAIDTLNKMDGAYEKQASRGGSLVVIPSEDMDL